MTKPSFLPKKPSSKHRHASSSSSRSFISSFNQFDPSLRLPPQSQPSRSNSRVKGQAPQAASSDNDGISVSSGSEDEDATRLTQLPRGGNKKEKPASSISQTIERWSNSKSTVGDASTRKVIQELAKVPLAFSTSSSGDRAVKETNNGYNKPFSGPANSGHSHGPSTAIKKAAKGVKGKHKATETQSTPFKVFAITFIPDGIVKSEGLTRRTHAADIDEGSFQPDLVDSLPGGSDTPSPAPQEILLLERQLVSATNRNIGFDFDENWSYEQVYQALATIFPVLFEYFSCLPSETYSDNDEGSKALFEHKSPFLLLIKTRLHVDVVPYTPYPNGEHLAATFSKKGGPERARLFFTTRRKIPPGILQAWSKGNHIMEAPPHPLAKRKRSQSLLSSDGPSSDSDSAGDHGFRSKTGRPQRKRIHTRSMSQSKASDSLKTMTGTTGKGETDDSPIIVDDDSEFRYSWWDSYTAGGVDSGSTAYVADAPPTRPPSPASNIAESQLQQLTSGSFSESLTLDDPWSASRSYEID